MNASSVNAMNSNANVCSSVANSASAKRSRIRKPATSKRCVSLSSDLSVYDENQESGAETNSQRPPSASGDALNSQQTNINTRQRPSPARSLTSVALPQRQMLVRTATAPTPSVVNNFSPPSSISPSSPYYDSSPQLASSPPIFGDVGNRFSPMGTGATKGIPKSWTSEAGHQMVGGGDGMVCGGTSPLSSVFDELMSSTLSLGDDHGLLNTSRDGNSLDLANDFVREFYRFDSESDISLTAADDTGERIVDDASVNKLIEEVAESLREAAEAATTNSDKRPDQRNDISETSSLSIRGSNTSDDLFENANSPITSPDPVNADGGVKQEEQGLLDAIRKSGLILPPASKTRSLPVMSSEIEMPSEASTPVFTALTPNFAGTLTDNSAATSTLKPKDKRAGRNKTKERIHETLMQSIATGKPIQYCQNCGDIMPHAWRRIKVLTKNNTMETLRVCNPCGLYYQSKKVMRPDHLWRRNRESSVISSDAIDLDDVPDKRKPTGSASTATTPVAAPGNSTDHSTSPAKHIGKHSVSSTTPPVYNSVPSTIGEKAGSSTASPVVVDDNTT